MEIVFLVMIPAVTLKIIIPKESQIVRVMNGSPVVSVLISPCIITAMAPILRAIKNEFTTPRTIEA
jgi:hypothetical protein